MSDNVGHLSTNDEQARYGQKEQVLANIAACRKALEAFHPIAPPQLMKELTEAVDRHEEAAMKASATAPPDPSPTDRSSS